MKRLIFGMAVTLALVSSLVVPSVAFADNHQHITVTGVPSFIAITINENTWTVNDTPGGAGDGLMVEDTKYYSNPAGDETAPGATVANASCYFEVTNASSSRPLTLTVNWGNFSGGGVYMNNSDDKTDNTGTTFAAASYCYGMTYSAAPDAKVTGSAAMKTGWSGSTLSWGLYIETQTDAWTSGTAMTSIVTITATAT